MYKNVIKILLEFINVYPKATFISTIIMYLLCVNFVEVGYKN